MNSAKYLTKIYWSREDGCYVAKVPALPGCVSHGDSYAKAAGNIEEAMTLWLDCAESHGDSIPESDLAREEIGRMADVLNLSKLARKAGINKHTLASKLRRKSKFTPDEAEKILCAIS